jgi:hypothetical protein
MQLSPLHDGSACAGRTLPFTAHDASHMPRDFRRNFSVLENSSGCVARQESPVAGKSCRLDAAHAGVSGKWFPLRAAMR